MKCLKKEKKKPWKMILICGIIICLTAVVAAGCLFFGISGVGSDEWKSAVVTNGEYATSVEIQTPYGNLQFEGDWVPSLRYKLIKGDVTELDFAAEHNGSMVNLFDLYFGSETEDLLGYLTTKAGKLVPVSAVVYDIASEKNWTETERETIFAMQDQLNVIIVQLGITNESVSAEEPAQEVSVETSLGIFTYMDKWNGGLRISETDGKIVGYGTVEGKTEQKLFVISVGGTGTRAVGFYTDKNGRLLPVFLETEELFVGGEWTAEEQQALYGMQNVLNDILEQLNLTDEQQTEAVKDVTVVTSYGTLVYPGQFDGKLRIDQDENNGYRLSAYAAMEGKSEIHLFDLLVGIPGDVYAGTLSGQDVYINVPDLVLDETWTETESAEIYGMQALLNDFTGQLSVEKPDEEEIPAETESAGDIVIQTTYGNMEYPGEYRQNLVVDRNFNNGYEVKFYAKMESGEKIHLFDVIIGGEGESHIGRITAKNGNSGELYITSYEFEPDNSWSEEEIQMILGMQEAVNYTLEKLENSGALVY